VADSLKALAEIVPMLGAAKVIGTNRRKIFADGSPGKVRFLKVVLGRVRLGIKLMSIK
jgi:hypothetical protein